MSYVLRGVIARSAIAKTVAREFGPSTGAIAATGAVELPQGFAVWENGTLAWGPISLSEGQPASAEGTPISQALRRIGVELSADAHDEFAAIGLGKHRHLEDWLPGMDTA